MKIVPTVTLPYTRDRIAASFIVTLNGIERNIPYNLFLSLFPRINSRNRTANVEASAAELEALSVIADISDPLSSRITYELSERHGGNFVVTHMSSGQQLVCLPGAFRRIAGVSNRAVSGTATLSATKLAEVGFIIEGGNNNDCNYQYANYA
ncbi:MAG TPA: hypothetical protein DEF35_04365 [Paenibacillus sp.]|uniref:hypothetical protein n=1 Tax=Paenibacillus TaxID=44249 RepID=UPI000B9FD3BD|nr:MULTISPECIES: hypothetical protein [Paenibacillus]OZQ60787.1 hypothetical protein CA599_29530 [Paenibacillus taichungensis]HBU80861.1 hypothetical protein [Paenibacillus sp.]